MNQAVLTQTNKSSLYQILRNELLPRVQKPGQYLGNEFGSAQKDWDKAKGRIALIYPDLYELGMSNFGIKILYNIVNNHSDYLCDRAFAPMMDMEELLRQRDLPLWGWESYQPLCDFDMLGFSLGYELVYTNILTMLSLVKIPFLSKDRDLNHPLIFAGGPAVFNPEVMADYMDFYLIGDGEELILEIQDSLYASKAKILKDKLGEDLTGLEVAKRFEELKASLDFEESKALRETILLDLAQIKGVYVPCFYKPNSEKNNMPERITDAVPEKIHKRVVNLDDLNQPTLNPVPNIQVVQDKFSMELRRGCDRGCRFCQPGYAYLPVRERSPEDMLRLSSEGIKNMGYEDYSLLSLSASDYTCLTEAARAMNDTHAENGVSLSMPSQRADRFNVNLAAEIQQVRKSGVTLAPEAGSEKMRRIINKGLKQDEIYRAIRNVYAEGWAHVKLYFMIGLPFEDDSDLDAILDILSWSINMSKELRRTNREKYRKPLKVTCTISTFVPKSFTPFQWFEQCSREEFIRKENYLKEGLKERRIARDIKLNCTLPDLAVIEAVLSRGDRRWGQVVKEIWDSGCRMDSWEEHFKFERWDEAAKKFGMDVDQEATRHREVGSAQPWDVLDIGLLNKFLVREWQLAENEAETLPCTENKCHACGVCFGLGVTNVVTKDLSDKNPFVTEIDIEKRKASCASMGDDIDLVTQKYEADSQEKYIRSLAENSEVLKQDNSCDTDSSLGENSDLEQSAQTANTKDYPLNGDGQKIIVKHFESQQRVRFVITKLGDLRFIGHLDFQRLVERALRRSELPVVHTTGFNQRMKISWGAALPLFIESKWEYLEIDLAFRFEDIQKIKDILNNQLPKEARILAVEEISTGKKSSINNIRETVYQAGLIEESNKTNLNTITQDLIDRFLARDLIEIEKTVKGKQKTKNIRDKIIQVQIIDPKTIELTLESTQRVDEVLASLIPDRLWQATKISQSIA